MLEPTHMTSAVPHRHAQFMPAMSLHAGVTWEPAAVVVLCKVRQELRDAVKGLLCGSTCSDGLHGPGLLFEGVQDCLHLVHEVEATAHLLHGST